MKTTKISTKSPDRLKVGEVSRQIARDTLEGVGLLTPFFRYCIASGDVHIYPDLRNAGCSFSAHRGPWDFQPLIKATKDRARARKLARLARKSDRHDAAVRRGVIPSIYERAAGETLGIRHRPENLRAADVRDDGDGVLYTVPDPRGRIEWHPDPRDRKKNSRGQTLKEEIEEKWGPRPLENPAGTPAVTPPQHAMTHRDFGVRRKDARRVWFDSQATKARNQIAASATAQLVELLEFNKKLAEAFTCSVEKLKSASRQLLVARDDRLDALEALCSRIKAEQGTIFEDIQVIYDRVRAMHDTVAPPIPSAGTPKKPASSSTKKPSPFGGKKA